MSAPDVPQSDPLAEGRRIYIGNLHYSLNPADIEDMLQSAGFEGVEKIHISVDPVSARNPGYCFAEFQTREEADRALAELRATVRGRAVKVGPCEPKRGRDGAGAGDRGGGRHRGNDRWGAGGDGSRREPRREADSAEGPFQRWGDWKTSDSQTDQPREQGPYRALEHFDGVAKSGAQVRRLYVGGLSKMVDQAQNQEEILEIFNSKGFKPEFIGKRITPHESTRARPGNHHYCFVDFETAEEASEAVTALNGTEYGPNNAHLRVAVSQQLPDKLQERSGDANNWRRPNRAAARGDDGGGAPLRNSATSSNERAHMTSGSWRRTDGA